MGSFPCGHEDEPETWVILTQCQYCDWVGVPLSRTWSCGRCIAFAMSAQFAHMIMTHWEQIGKDRVKARAGEN
jgi:hypothetical protein